MNKIFVLISVLLIFPSLQFSQKSAQMKALGSKKTVDSRFIKQPKPIIKSVSPSYHRTHIKFLIKGDFFGNARGTQKMIMVARRSSRIKELNVTSWSNTQIVAKTTGNVEWEPYQWFYIYDPANPPASGEMENSNKFNFILKTHIFLARNKPNRVRNNREAIQPIYDNRMTILGTLLGTGSRGEKVFFDGSPAKVITWRNTEIVIEIPNLLKQKRNHSIYLKSSYEVPFVFSNILKFNK